jgi:hypothetical protein
MGFGFSAFTIATGGIGQLAIAGYLLYLVPVFSIIGLVMAFVPLARMMKGVAMLVSGILVMVPVIYVLMQPGAMAFISYGAWLSLIGGIVLLVAGIMGLVMKPEAAAQA